MPCTSLDEYGVNLRRAFSIPEESLIEIIEDSAKPPKQLRRLKVRWNSSDDLSRSSSRWENLNSSIEDFSSAPPSFPVRQISAQIQKPLAEKQELVKSHIDGVSLMISDEESVSTDDQFGRTGSPDSGNMNRVGSFWEIDFAIAPPPNMPKREVSLDLSRKSSPVCLTKKSMPNKRQNRLPHEATWKSRLPKQITRQGRPVKQSKQQRRRQLDDESLDEEF